MYNEHKNTLFELEILYPFVLIQFQHFHVNLIHDWILSITSKVH